MRISGWSLWISAILGVSALTGCEAKSDSRPASPPAEASPETPALGPGAGSYSVPERTEAALRQELAEACVRAQSATKPMLLEFSAPWCGDCRRLAEMKNHPALSQALEQYEVVVVNVGEFDRHRWLLSPFAVRAIARWEVLGTSDCRSSADRWPRFGGRTLEPTQREQHLTEAGLARWLDGRRASALARL